MIDKEEVRTDYCISCDNIKEIHPNEYDMTICKRCWDKYVVMKKEVQ